jgi:hypothetical protein
LKNSFAHRIGNLMHNDSYLMAVHLVRAGRGAKWLRLSLAYRGRSSFVRLASMAAFISDFSS